MNITQEEAKWILATYEPIRGHGKIGKSPRCNTRSISNNERTTCTYGVQLRITSISKITSDMFDQHKTQIEALANSVIEDATETGI